MLNYALSVTAVPLVPYFLASSLAVRGWRWWAGVGFVEALCAQPASAVSAAWLAPDASPRLPPSLPAPQILPYLLLFVYFGSLARNLADVFTGRAGLGTNGTIAFAVIRRALWVVLCPRHVC